MEDVRPFVHRPDVNEEPDICPECSGRGIAFMPVGTSVRIEIKCPSCEGSGKRSTALARRLSDEWEPPTPIDKEFAKIYFTRAHS